MTIGWDVHVIGADQVEADLIRSAEKAEDTLNIMYAIFVNMLEAERRLFESQGRRGGGSWKSLKPETVAKKGSTQILITEGAKPYYSQIEGALSRNTLFRSLTEPNAPYQVQEITNETVVLGTTRPAAAMINAERPFIRFLPGDVERWSLWLAEHVLAPFIKETYGRAQYNTGPYQVTRGLSGGE